MKTPRVAVALCLHHKPWLAMGTLISLLVQDEVEYDIYLLFNVGDGHQPGKAGYAAYNALGASQNAAEVIARSHDMERASYHAYDQYARQHGVNPKLSAFDERLRDVCQIKRNRVFTIDYENDQALDSGVWLKFIRSGLWRDYEYVFTFQEGTLLTSQRSLVAALTMAERHHLPFLASAHMKGRMAKHLYAFPCQSDRDPNCLDIDRFHDRMAQETLAILCRDDDLRRAFDAWNGAGPATRQYHVRDYETTWRLRALDRLLKDRPLTGSTNVRRLKKAMRAMVPPTWTRSSFEFLLSLQAVRLHDWLGLEFAFHRRPDRERIFVDGARRTIESVVATEFSHDVLFHQAREAGWHAAGCNHMFSRSLLEDLSRRLEAKALYDVLDVPFAGSLLEVFWCYIPAWLGFDLWYWDGFHRVTKDPWTLEREDTAGGLALHLNRYAFGRLAARADGDFLVLEALARDTRYLRDILPSPYFP